MDDELKLSICLPTYNRLEYLRLTINHLIRELQNVAISHEIIVLDGGSNDGTIEFLGKIDKVKVRQGGLVDNCSCTGELIRCAKGRYIYLLTDKLLVNMKPIVSACRILDKDAEFGGLFANFSLVMKRAWFKPVYVSHKMVMGDICLFRRSDALKYWDSSYHRGQCNTDFYLRLFFAGKFIGFPHYVAAFELKFRHYDYLQVAYKWPRSNRDIDQSKLEKKYTKHFQLLDSYNSRQAMANIRVAIFSWLLVQFQRLVLSNRLAFIFRILNRRGDSRSRLEKFPTISKDELPPGFGLSLPGLYPDDSATIYKKFLSPNIAHTQDVIRDVEDYLSMNHNFLKQISKKKEWKDYFVEQELDQRVHAPFVREIWEWLLNGTAAFLVKNHEYKDDLFLVQKLPTEVVNATRKLMPELESDSSRV